LSAPYSALTTTRHSGGLDPQSTFLLVLISHLSNMIFLPCLRGRCRSASAGGGGRRIDWTSYCIKTPSER